MFNIGLMGHVDSGKTTIAKWLSQHASTAAFDKSPQSQSRGITLDLGFSSFVLPPASREEPGNKIPATGTRVTLVDCPGHAAMFRTVIGAAGVVDGVLLVVDGGKGVQTQTAECAVLAGIVTKHLIVAVNKADLVTDIDGVVAKIKRQLQSALVKFTTCQFVAVSAKTNNNKEGLLEAIAAISKMVPPRDASKPFLMAIDHGFAIRGQGHILTGTILQGRLSVGETIIIPDLPGPVKVKSMQSYHQPVRQAIAGDRVGCCIDGCPVKIERSVAVRSADQKQLTSAFMMSVQKIPFYKETVHSKQRLHISVLHSTVLCKQIIFCRLTADGTEYEWLDRIEDGQCGYAVVVLEEPILVPKDFTVIGSKMDMNIESKSCRLCLHGTVVDSHVDLGTLRLFKWKERRGLVDRVVDVKRAIGRGLVDREGGVISKFLGWRVHFCDSICGTAPTCDAAVIQSAFGTTGKFNLQTKSQRTQGDAFVMRFKKYTLQPGKPIKQ